MKKKVWFVLLKNYFPAQAIQHLDSKIPDRPTINQAIVLMKQSELNHKAKPIGSFINDSMQTFLLVYFPNF